MSHFILLGQFSVTCAKVVVNDLIQTNLIHAYILHIYNSDFFFVDKKNVALVSDLMLNHLQKLSAFLMFLTKIH